MFERPEAGDSAVLVHIDFANSSIGQEDLTEFEELARSASVNILAVVTGKRTVPDSRYFIGRGKLTELQEIIQSQQADIVLFNHALQPSQERNLERTLQCRVVDRTGLILDIFAQRARTHEGKLQVELAQLQYLATRLIRGWTHLERQKGGIGLRGPGEKQLETDRRLLRQRIKNIENRLRLVRRRRAQGRRVRSRAAIPTIALVGYTNAGKSTLFHALTGSEVFVADQLFATLDPTMRQIHIAKVGKAILADTVGFIRHLPHTLIEAFRATLEEVQQADLILHVIDASDGKRRAHIEQVQYVLQEIKATHIPQLLVFNKIDSLSHIRANVERDEHGKALKVWLSALKNQGLELLQQAIGEYLITDMIRREFCLFPTEAKLHHQLRRLGVIYQENIDEQGHITLIVYMSALDFQKLFL